MLRAVHAQGQVVVPKRGQAAQMQQQQQLLQQQRSLLPLLSLLLSLSVLYCARAAAAAAAAAAVTTTPATPVFSAGEAGYACFRIPALLALSSSLSSRPSSTSGGALLAFAEARRFSCADHGYVDLVLKRSADGGATWSALSRVWGASDAHRNVTVGNPAPVEDPATGVVWLPFCEDNTRVFVTHSADGGRSWARTPRDITAVVRRAGWGWYATGPPGSLSLGSGRLVVPCNHQPAGAHSTVSHVFLSDDHGASWRLGGSVPGPADGAPPSSECQAAQAANGTLYLAIRTPAGVRRLAALSADGGDSWGAPVATDLPQPLGGCEGSIVAAGRRLFFSGPASRTVRENMTVFESTADLAAWKPRAVVWAGPTGYSSLAVGADGRRLLVLFEMGKVTSYEGISFAALEL